MGLKAIQPFTAGLLYKVVLRGKDQLRRSQALLDGIKLPAGISGVSAQIGVIPLNRPWGNRDGPSGRYGHSGCRGPKWRLEWTTRGHRDRETLSVAFGVAENKGMRRMLKTVQQGSCQPTNYCS